MDVRPLSVAPVALTALSQGRPLAVSGAAHVTGITLASSDVRPGDLFCALPGAVTHGARFAAAAVAAGAVAVLTDDVGAPLVPAGTPVLVAADPRSLVGGLAQQVYGDPSRSMDLHAVTGTNGKTTTAYVLEAALRGAGVRTGLLGTVQARVGEDALPSVRTTPEAPALTALLATMRERGATDVALEVSSHALVLGRVDGLRFRTGIFTNLSQDHLDFHPTLEAYFAAKLQLVERAETAVVCVDDPWGARAASVRADTVTVATTGGDARWQASAVVLGPGGSTFTLTGDGHELAVSTHLPGAFNVANVSCAVVALVTCGVDPVGVLAGIASLPGVPGRMERVDAGQAFTALVDYAHTPDAVATVLAAVRPLTGRTAFGGSGRVLVVLGCGGDRDAGKRPQMAAAAVAGADVVVLTDDNPRSESSSAILEQMLGGVPGGCLGRVHVEADRRAAIALAVAAARPGDVLVVAGKGHESGQDVGGVVTPFDDRLVLATALAEVAG